LIGCSDQNIKNVIYFGIAQSPQNLDPRFQSDAASERISELIYSPLFYFDKNYKAQSNIVYWEKVNRLKGSEASHTFHGRDVYAYTGARLAASEINFEQVGPKLVAEVFSIPFEAARIDTNKLIGGIPILDPAYGNVWTNIPMSLLLELTNSKDYANLYAQEFLVTVTHADKLVLSEIISFERSFAGVSEGQPLLYVNSLENLALALNQANFAKKFDIQAGGEWRIEIVTK
jgi:hypothetical protein